MNVGDHPPYQFPVPETNEYKSNYQGILKPFAPPSLPVDDPVLEHVRQALAEARKDKDLADDPEIKRKIAIFVTEMEKCYAWWFTYLMGG